MSSPLIFILSSRVDAVKHELLYNILINKIKYPVYIAYGDPTIKRDCIIDNKYISVKSPDDYDNTDVKIKKIYKFIHKNFQNHTGFIKINCDMYLNIELLFWFISKLESKDGNLIDYTGVIVNREKNSYILVDNPKSFAYNGTNVYCPICTYCKGGIFYFSIRTLNTIAPNFKTTYFDDITFGMNCNNKDCNKIYPTETGLYYSEESSDFLKSHVRNNLFGTKYLFTRLHNDLGTQMFQIASTYGLAVSHRMLPIFVYSNKDHYDKKILIDNDFYKNIPFVFVDYLKTYKEELNIHTYDGELRGTNFLIKHPIIVKNISHYIDGFFQNEKYFIDIKDIIIKMFYNQQKVDDYLKKYKKLKDSYFIHIPTKNYMNNSLFRIDHETYILKCIERDPSAHYYILSDNIEIIRKSDFLDMKTNITYVEDMSEIDLLYFMSSAGKGGICSNTPFSWWGGYLCNSISDNKIYLPKKWINNNTRCDIYFQGSHIIDF
jgi:hypothetical protein